MYLQLPSVRTKKGHGRRQKKGSQALGIVARRLQQGAVCATPPSTTQKSTQNDRKKGGGGGRILPPAYSEREKSSDRRGVLDLQDEGEKKNKTENGYISLSLRGSFSRPY